MNIESLDDCDRVDSSEGFGDISKSHPRPQGRKLKPSTMANHNRRKERSLMTKTFIIKNAKSTTGYSIKVVEDDKTNIVDIEKISKPDHHGVQWLILPENPANRQYMALPKAEKIEKELELEYRETRTIGPRGNSKKLEDYMTDEEKKLVEEIMNRCKERKANDKPKELTPLEKAMRNLEKYQKEVEELKKKEAEEAKA